MKWKNQESSFISYKIYPSNFLEWIQSHLIVYKSFDFTQLEIRSDKQNHLVMTILGRGVSLDDQLRQEFAYKNGVLCYDSELDSVVESVYGKNHLISVPFKCIFNPTSWGGAEQKWQF